MPPATTSKRPREPRPPRPQAPPPSNVQPIPPPNEELFTDPMMGAALIFYVDKDVPDKDRIEQLITVCFNVILCLISG